MGHRAALLIHCSQEEASRIHEQAKLEHRTVSGYVLNIVMRAVGFEEVLFARFKRIDTLKRILFGRPLRLPGPRTALLLRCSTEESKRIRAVAKNRETTISAFVLWSLRRSWDTAEQVPLVPRPLSATRKIEV